MRCQRRTVWVFAFALLSVVPVLAQQAGPTSAVESQASEGRLRAVEVEQQYLRQALKDHLEATKFLIGGFASLIVLIQLLSGGFQAWRENKAYERQAKREDELEHRRAEHDKSLFDSARERDDAREATRLDRERQLFNFWTEREKHLEARRTQREDKLDDMTRGSVDSVNKVLEVVYNTFKERREAEEEARKATDRFQDQIKKLTDTIDALNGKIQDLEGFAADVRRTNENERQAIELRAREITKATPRHLIRQQVAKFVEFARLYDAFRGRQGSTENPGDDSGFSIYVRYVRGIAAHYTNDPALLTSLLNAVVSDKRVQAGEEAVHRNKRHVVAYYFLGLTESNFGNYDGAIEAFQHAIDLEGEPKDVLSRLVAAEAAAFASRTVEASRYLDEVEGILSELRKQHDNANNSFPFAFRRHGYRAALIRANMAIRSGKSQRDRAVELLRSVGDANEYYVLATLAQVLAKSDPQSREAKALFEKAYRSIQNLSHLTAVVETRSRILLLLVAGMCSQHADERGSMTDEHFAEAQSLLSALPDRNGQPCTVFSVLSKRNVDKHEIAAEIGALRDGSVLADYF